MVKTYGDDEFSIVRADTFSFSDGAFSFLGGTLGALTPSQIRTGSPPECSPGWEVIPGESLFSEWSMGIRSRLIAQIELMANGTKRRTGFIRD